MAIKCQQSLKVKLLLFFIIAFGVSSFAQKDKLLKIYSATGYFDSYDNEKELLDLKINDSLVTFNANSVFLDPDSYSTLIDQNKNWSNSKNKIQLMLNYFINVYYESSTNKIRHKLTCINLENEELLDSINSYLIPKYDTIIYKISGKLKRVELGDYLHIQIVDNNNKTKNLWIHAGMNRNTINKLYDCEGSNLNIPVDVKYYKAINWIHEHGGPMLNETCIDLIFNK